MFATQVAVSEIRYIRVERLIEINEWTGKEFPVSGDAKLKHDYRMLVAKIEAVKLLVQP